MQFKTSIMYNNYCKRGEFHWDKLSKFSRSFLYFSVFCKSIAMLMSMRAKLSKLRIIFVDIEDFVTILIIRYSRNKPLFLHGFFACAFIISN